MKKINIFLLGNLYAIIMEKYSKICKLKQQNMFFIFPTCVHVCNNEKYA